MVSMHLDPTITDLTGLTPKSNRKGSRPSARIDAVVLHQTSYSRGETATNYLNTVAHFVVTQGGSILQLHPIAELLWASSAFNPDSVSIEFVGNFRSDRGLWWTGDPGRHKPTTNQISAGRDLIMYLNEKHGIWNIFAHRQGEDANKRGNCPGPEIWYEIGEWAKSRLGMDDGGGNFKEGTGSAIPDSWRRPLP